MEEPRVRSFIILCPTCGDVWARYFDGIGGNWIAHSSVCRKCPWRFEGSYVEGAPGTLTKSFALLMVPESFIPLSLWLRDMHLEMIQREREMEYERRSNL